MVELTGSAPEHGLRLDRSWAEDVHTIALSGELTLTSVAALEEALQELTHLWARRLVLDLGDLTFIDSSGLWAVTSAARWCARNGCTLRLLPGSEGVQQVFETTGLSDVLPFEPRAAG